MSAFEPFEAFGDVEAIAAGLDDPDPGTRRVAVMDLADTAAAEAIPHLDSRDRRPSLGSAAAGGDCARRL